MNRTHVDSSTLQDPRLSLRKKLFFMAVVVFFCLGVAEIGLRLAWTRPALFVGERLRDINLFTKDALLGWRMRPNQDIEFAFFGKRTVRIRTNSAGFRDQERSFDRQEGRARVLVLGDSFAFGYGVAQEECFSAYLAELIPEAEILNLGVTGYNVAQARGLFEGSGARYRPDVVLHAFVQNDVGAQDIPTAQSHREQRNEGGFKAVVCRHSYLADFVRDRISRNKSLAKLLVRIGIKEEFAGYDQLDLNLRPSLRTYPPELAAQWEATLSELRLLEGACKESGARLVVVLVPAREAVEASALDGTIAYVDFVAADFDLDRPYREMGTMLRSWDVPVVDPVASFRSAAETNSKLYLPLDMHFSPDGHRLLASEIAPHLRAALALPSR